MAIPPSRNDFILLDDSPQPPAAAPSGGSKEQRRADKAERNRSQAKAAGSALHDSSLGRHVYPLRPNRTATAPAPKADTRGTNIAQNSAQSVSVMQTELHTDVDGSSLADWGTDSEYAAPSTSSADPQPVANPSFKIRISNKGAAAASASARAQSGSVPAHDDSAVLNFRTQAAANALIRRGRRHRVRYFPALPTGVDAAAVGRHNINAIRIVVGPNGKTSTESERARHAELVRPFTRHLSSGARQVEAARVFLAHLFGAAAIKTAEIRRILSLAPSRLQVFAHADAVGAPAAAAEAMSADVMAVDDGKQSAIPVALGSPRLRLLVGPNLRVDAVTKKIIIEICYEKAADCAAVEKAVCAAVALGLHSASDISVEQAPALWFRFRLHMSVMDSVEDAYALLAGAGIPRDGCVIANADSGCFAPRGRQYLYAPDVYARSGFESALGHPSLQAAQVQILMSPPPMCRTCGTLGATSRNCRSKRCVAERRAGHASRSLCFRCGALADSAHHRACKAKAVASLCLCCGGNHFTLRCEKMRQHFAHVSPSSVGPLPPPSAGEFVPLGNASADAHAVEREDGELSAGDSALSDQGSDDKVRPPSLKRPRKAPPSPPQRSYAKAVGAKSPAGRAGGLVSLSQQRQDDKDAIIAQQARLIASLTAQVQDMQRAMGRMERLLENMQQPVRDDTHDAQRDSSDGEWEQQRRRNGARKHRRSAPAAEARAPKKKVTFAMELEKRRAGRAALSRSTRKRRAKHDWIAASLLSSSSDEDALMIVDGEREEASAGHGATRRANAALAELHQS